MSESHKRKCWDCGNVAVHMRSIVPEVLCAKCGSQDTRRIKEEKQQQLTLYELINPSDPYTFYAPSIEVAGVCAVLLSAGFGAQPASGDGERTPILFGWKEWLDDRGINDYWVESHRYEIADCYDSFLIGDAAKRADVESMLEMLPEEKRNEWRDQRQERQRSSISKIGEAAYARAAAIRKGKTKC